MILIKIFLVLMSFLVLFLLALLFIPLPYSMFLCLHQNKVELRVKTLWLVKIRFSSANQTTVSLAGRKLPMKPGKPQPSSTTSTSTRSERQSGNWRSYFKRELFSQAWSMLRAVLQHVLPQKVILRGRIGLDDPYLTGLLFIFLPLLERIPGGDINLEPVWDDWNHELAAIVSGRIIIIVLVYHGLRFFFSPIFRRIRREQKQIVKAKCNPGLVGRV